MPRFEEQDPNSILACYQRLLKIRKENRPLHSGALTLIDKSGFPKNVLAYSRSYANEKCYIFLNFQNKGEIVILPENLQKKDLKFLASTYVKPQEFQVRINIQLEPFEGIILMEMI